MSRCRRVMVLGMLLGGCAEAAVQLTDRGDGGPAGRGDGAWREAGAPDAGVPDFQDVYPLFRHHCSGSRCHNQDPAPAGLRLANADARVAEADAVARAARIHQRINDKSDPMPPTRPLDDEVRSALSLWAAAIAR